MLDGNEGFGWKVVLMYPMIPKRRVCPLGSPWESNMAAQTTSDAEIQNLACNTGQKRPFKICNSSREGKKGIACSSLQELKDISRERFLLGPECRVFLESDGTEVDNEEYFQFLPPQTLFMVTENNERWIKTAEDTPCKFYLTKCRGKLDCLKICSLGYVNILRWLPVYAKN